jgi:hypothetical protein
MVMKKLLGSAALVAVLTASGSSSPMDVAESRVAYLDVMCPLDAQVEAFFEVQKTTDWAQIRLAAGPLSVAEAAAADGLDEHHWDPSLASHIPAISASLRGTSAIWADVAESGTSSNAPSLEVVEAGDAARDAVNTALQIEFPQVCVDR